MNAIVARNEIAREKLVRLGALALLLVLGGLTLMGPYGVLSWGEDVAVLEKREHKIAELRARRDELQNLVERLNPEHVDPDLATELMRRKLNVAHPDEYVIEIDPSR